MKKRIFLFTIAVTGVITAIAVVQLRRAAGNEILNANVEALAGPGIVVIPCQFAKLEECEYPEFVAGPEGDLVFVGYQTKGDMRKVNPSN